MPEPLLGFTGGFTGLGAVPETGLVGLAGGFAGGLGGAGGFGGLGGALIFGGLFGFGLEGILIFYIYFIFLFPKDII
jgi:hypothetical protein